MPPDTPCWQIWPKETSDAESWRFLAGAGIVLAITMIAVAAPMLAPLRSQQVQRLLPATALRAAWFGTDELGRDILSRVIYGARTSLVIGVGAALVAVSDRRADRAQRPATSAAASISWSCPSSTCSSRCRPGAGADHHRDGRPVAARTSCWCSASSCGRRWPGWSEARRSRCAKHAYIEAAVAAGGSSLWIIRRHVWPNIMRVVAAQFAITVSFAIITSASLSFLGLGIPPPMPDWGSMVRSGFEFWRSIRRMSLAPGSRHRDHRAGLLPAGTRGRVNETALTCRASSYWRSRT